MQGRKALAEKESEDENMEFEALRVKRIRDAISADAFDPCMLRTAAHIVRDSRIDDGDVARILETHAEILGALEKVKKYYDFPDPSDPIPMSEVMDAVNGAIARAKGETP